MSQKHFGERLAKARNAKGFTQDEIAKYLDMTRVAVANYESGKRFPDFETIVRLAKKYDVSTDYFFCLTDTMIRNENVKDICEYTGLSDLAIQRLHYFSLERKNEYATLEEMNSEISLAFIDKLVNYKDYNKISQLAYESVLYNDEDSPVEEYRYIKKMMEFLKQCDFSEIKERYKHKVTPADVVDVFVKVSNEKENFIIENILEKIVDEAIKQIVEKNQTNEIFVDDTMKEGEP